MLNPIIISQMGSKKAVRPGAGRRTTLEDAPKRVFSIIRRAHSSRFLGRQRRNRDCLLWFVSDLVSFELGGTLTCPIMKTHYRKSTSR
jgi:hypothetical protein